MVATCNRHRSGHSDVATVARLFSDAIASTHDPDREGLPHKLTYIICVLPSPMQDGIVL